MHRFGLLTVICYVLRLVVCVVVWYVLRLIVGGCVVCKHVIYYVLR